MQEFNKILKELRNNRNIVQKDIADVLGISVRAYQHYETGTRFPDFQGLITLADYFDVSLDYLVARSNTRERQP